jgi:hypothetical protein
MTRSAGTTMRAHAAAHPAHTEPERHAVRTGNYLYSRPVSARMITMIRINPISPPGP